MTIEISPNAMTQLVGAISTKQGTQSGSTHQATVLRTDNDGTIWVHIPGGADETPVHSTTAECAPGDTVSVTIANGRATIDGNATSPASTVRSVGVVRQTAETAQLTANDAAEAAASAIEDATLARAAATSAQTSAQEAETAATAATTAAGNAQVAANAATFALSDVEKVVGTLEWIAEHGEYQLTTDTAVVAGKVYYTRSGTDPNYVYTVVAEPKTADIATYYELHMDESVQNFIATHLWLDQYGLNLSVDGANGYRIHQGTVDGTKSMGMYVLNATGTVVASFGADGAQIGKSSSGHMNISSEGFELWGGSAYGNLSVMQAYIDHYNQESPTLRVGRNSNGHVVVNNESVSIWTRAARRVADFSDTVLIGPFVNYNPVAGWTELDYHSLTMLDTHGEEYLHVSDLHDSVGAPEKDVYVGDGATRSFNLSYHATGTIALYINGEEIAAPGIIPYKAPFNVADKTIDHQLRSSATLYASVDTPAEGDEVVFYYKTDDTDRCAFTFGSRRTSLTDPTTVAPGSVSFGHVNKATGRDAFAVGDYIIAASENQMAIGRYNVEDANDEYAFIIGNGTDDSNRSNALTVGWDGSVDAAGKATIGDGLEVSGGSTFNNAVAHYGSEYFYNGSVIYANAHEIDYTETPTANKYIAPIRARDMNGYEIGHCEWGKMANGRFVHNFASIRSPVNDSWSWRQCQMFVDSSGTVSYVIHTPAAFCEALHVGDRVAKDQSSNVSIVNTTWKNICSISLPAGTWVIEANVQWASNATGRRHIGISETSDSSGAARQTNVSTNAVSGGVTCQHTGATKVYTATTTVYLTGWQSSGAALNAQGLITAVRIK